MHGLGFHARVARGLRTLGVLLLASALLGFSSVAWSLLRHGAPVAVAIDFVLGLLLAGAALAWVSFAARSWQERRPRAAIHVLLLAVAFLVLAAWDLAFRLLGLAAAFEQGWWTAAFLLGLVLSGLQAVLCVGILRNRAQAVAGGELDASVPALPVS